MTALPELLSMPSKTNELLRSIRHLLIVGVFLLGLGVATLGDIAIAIRQYETPIPAVARVIGSAVVFVALVLLFVKVFQINGDDRSED